jgi:hypothetical protein
VLLQRQMRCEDPALEGRLVLASIFESAYEVLARVDLIQQDSPLRASGLMALEDDEDNPEDLLEARFILSEEGVEGFRQEIVGTPARDNPTPGRGDPFVSNRELLVEMRVMHNLYRVRSDRVFSHDRWNRLHSTSFQPARSVGTRIRDGWARLRDRLGVTPKASSYPAVRLMREYDLSEEEVMCVIHLLFKELFEGNAYADIADLLKLISRDEAELIRNRRLFAENSTLIKREIIRVEPLLEGRNLTGEAYLSDWVVNYIFGATSGDENIQPDERIDWHVYLQKLEDSKGFYRDLDG